MLSHLLNNFEIQRFQNEIYNKIQYSKKVLYVKFNTSGEKDWLFLLLVQGVVAIMIKHLNKKYISKS